MNTEDVIRKAQEFNYWFFSHDLGDGQRIHATEEKYREMHFKKRDHILTPAINLLYGESLQGISVLDCGCNSGFFTFECARRLADYVLGLEGQDEFLRQAQMLNEYFQYSNVELKSQNLAELNSDILPQFDLVLLMGVIYYFENPIAFLKEVAKIAKRAVVIDSETLFFENAIFDMKFQSDPPNPFGGLSQARLVPSVGAIKAMLYISGFKSYRLLDGDKVGKEYCDCRITLVASKEDEDGFDSLENQPFDLNDKLGHFEAEDIVPFAKK